MSNFVHMPSKPAAQLLRVDVVTLMLHELNRVRFEDEKLRDLFAQFSHDFHGDWRWLLKLFDLPQPGDTAHAGLDGLFALIAFAYQPNTQMRNE